MPEPTEIAIHVAGRMRQRRQELGLKQDQAAQKIGWHTKTYCNKENNLRGLSVEDLYVAAKAFDVTPNYFYEGL